MAINSETIQILVESTQVEQFKANLRELNVDIQQKKTVKIDVNASDIDKAKQAMSGLNTEVQRVGHSNQGVNRELLVLTHELSQGQYKRFGGSLMVLAEQMNLLGSITPKAAFGLIAAGAAIYLFAHNVAEGHHETLELNKALLLTNGYSALTQGAMNDLAHSLDGNVHGSIGKVRDALQQMAKSGTFTNDQIKEMAPTVMQISYLTGETTAKVVKDFEKMSHGVAKFASEHNEQYHSLTFAQFKHIESLEKQGKKTEAMTEYVNALNVGFAAQKDQISNNLGYWEKMVNLISKAADGVKEIGRADAPSAKELGSRVNAQQKIVDNASYSYIGPNPKDTAKLADLKERLSKAQVMEKEAADKVNAQKDQDEMIRQDKWLQNLKNRNKTNLELAKDEHIKLDELRKLRNTTKDKDGKLTPMSDGEYKSAFDTIDRMHTNGRKPLRVETEKNLDNELKNDRLKLDLLNGLSQEQAIINKYKDEYYSKYNPKQVEEAKDLALLIYKTTELKEIRNGIANQYSELISNQLQSIQKLKEENDLSNIKSQLLLQTGTTIEDITVAQNKYNQKIEEGNLLTAINNASTKDEAEELTNKLNVLKQLNAEKNREVLKGGVQRIGNESTHEVKGIKDNSKQAIAETLAWSRVGATWKSVTQEISKNTIAKLENSKVGKSKDEVAIINAQIKAEKDKTRAIIETTNAQKKWNESVAGFSAGWNKAAEDFRNKAKDMQQIGTDLYNGISDSATNSLTGFMTGTRSAKEAFADFSKSVLEQIMKIIAQQMVMNSMQSMFGGSGSVFGGLFGGGGSPKMMANGGIVADRPTALGNNIFGEAGKSEVAFAPLRNMASGNLGVEVSGVGGGDGGTNVIINVTVEGGKDAKETGDAIGSKAAEKFIAAIARREIAQQQRYGR